MGKQKMTLGTYVLQRYDVSGLEVFGRRQADGTLLIGSDHETATPVANWPSIVELFGIEYTLAEVIVNSVSQDHPGAGIEWGRYE